MSLISICIPTYNGAQFLQESLDSVSAQSYKNIEVVISDDNSSDETLQICKNFKENSDFPVSIYKHHPQGIGANWNYCIEKANGEYIKLLFQDDILEPECISKMFIHLKENHLDIVLSKRKIIDEKSNPVTSGEWLMKYGDLQQMAGLENHNLLIISKKTFSKMNFQLYSSENFIGEPCVSMFSKKLYMKTGRFNTELKQALDYEYWLRCLKHFDIGIINEKLVQFRFHSNQTSNLNANESVNEGKAIKDILFEQHLFYIDRKQAKYYIKQKFPLLKKIIAFRYKLFS